MDRIDRSLTRGRRLRQLHIVFVIVRAAMMLYLMWYMTSISVMRSIQLQEGKRSRKRLRLVILKRLTRESDVFCRNELRMNRNVFNVLCEMLRDIGGLSGTKNMSIEEIVAIFLYTLAHHKKNRSLGHYFIRSGESVSRHFNKCLMAVLKLHGHLLKTPTPISDDCEDDRWKSFKTHKKAKGLYGVPFPYYSMLAEIYGKDKATGQASESFIQAATNIEMDLTRESVTLDSDDEFDVEVETENESMQSGSSSRKRKDSSSLKSAKKYKTSMKRMENVGDLASSLQSVTVGFGKVFEDMNSNLSTMAQVWRSEEERKKKLDDETNNILEEVLKLDFLSPSDALKAASILMAEEHKLRLFYQASATFKKQYIADLIRNK